MKPAKASRRNQLAIGVMILPLITVECGAAEYVKGTDYFATFFSFRDSFSSGCAVSEAMDLSVGQPVSVAVLSKPQRLITGSVTSKSGSACKDLAKFGLRGTFYEIAFSDARIEQGDIGILIGKKVNASSRAKEGRAGARINGMTYTFDKCTSEEGIHLMVRSLKNGHSKLVWHDYMHLQYGVEPTCDEKLLDAMDSLNKSFNSDAQKRAQ